MKKLELLAPAGDYLSGICALSSGADAIYLGLDAFNARAYAKNFSIDELEKITKYAHLRFKKIYVTLNVMFFEGEIQKLKPVLDDLLRIGVDALIVADLGLIKYLKQNYPAFHLHASTQNNVFTSNAALILKEMGVERIIASREIRKDEVKKNIDAGLEVELFCHGSMCYSSSGNCLMSACFGGRSGNRGCCAGPCRLQYELLEDGKVISEGSLLSMKDLNTLDYLDEFIDLGITSIKIEGRMKGLSYLENVVKLYRDKIDSKEIDEKNLKYAKASFNREATSGYLFNETDLSFTNPKQVNNLGLFIGKVTEINPKTITFTTNTPLKVGEGIRIKTKTDIGFYLNKNYVEKRVGKNLFGIIPNTFSAKLGDEVYLTAPLPENNYLKEKYLDDSLRLNLELKLKIDSSKISAEYLVNDFSIKGKYAEKLDVEGDNPLNEKRIEEVFNKLTSTRYKLSSFLIEENKCFVNIATLNKFRNNLIKEIDQKVDEIYYVKSHTFYNLNHQLTNKHLLNEPLFEIVVPSLEVKMDIEKEFGNKLNFKVFVEGLDYSLRLGDDPNKLVVHSLNQISIGSLQILSPYANIASSEAVSTALDLGIDHLFLSLELDDKEACKMAGKFDNLGLFIYGKPDLMVSSSCVVGTYKSGKRNCGNCKIHKYQLKALEKDATFELILEKDANCSSRILASSTLNKLIYLNKYIDACFKYFMMRFESLSEARQVLNSIIDNKFSDKNLIFKDIK